MFDRQIVINIALAEVGYLEKRSNAQLDDKTANAGDANYTKYGRDMHALYPAVMDFPAAWCDCFVDWCFQKAYGVSNAKGLLSGDFDDYTVGSAALYKKKNAYIRRGAGEPEPGDQIFFNNGIRICHTGLVYKADGQKVYTVEGNTSGGSTLVANGGGVAKKSYPLNYAKIDGYGRPNYGDKASPAAQGASYYLRYTGTSNSLVDALKNIGEKDVSLEHRKKLALANEIKGAKDYRVGNTEVINNEMLRLLKAGKLAKAN